MSKSSQVWIVAAAPDAAEELSDAAGEAVSVISVGMIPKGSVARWVGVPEPVGDDDLLVNLVAPDREGRPPSRDWAYVRNGRWGWEPDGASSCFNHTDLLAVRLPEATR